MIIFTGAKKRLACQWWQCRRPAFHPKRLSFTRSRRRQIAREATRETVREERLFCLWFAHPFLNTPFELTSQKLISSLSCTYHNSTTSWLTELTSVRLYLYNPRTLVDWCFKVASRLFSHKNITINIIQFFLATLHLYQDIWRIGGDRGKVKVSGVGVGLLFNFSGDLLFGLF